MLLIDRTLSSENCQVNIFWATNNYANLGDGYQYSDQITLEAITGKNGDVIKPRAVKSREMQQKRSREIAVPRQIAMYLTRELTEMSLTQIGAAFNRDHTTVIHACEKVSEDARSDAATANLLEDLRRAVRSR